MRILISTLLFVSSWTAFAGNESGNGIDELAVLRNTAWFVGSEKEIKGCTSYSPEFGLDYQSSKEMLIEAFSIWNRYIKNDLSDDSDDDALMPASKLVLLGDCRKHPDSDLKVFFGVENDQVKDYKKQFLAPMAFALRTEYDVDKRWGKGIIWIAKTGGISPGYPKWDGADQYNLLGVLSHEAGHVVGNSHVEGTIMRKNISKILHQVSLLEKLRFAKNVDHELNLSRPISKEQKWDGLFGTAGDNFHLRNPLNQSQLFELFVGRLPKGVPSASLRWRYQGQVARLTIKDEAGSHVIPISFYADGRDWGTVFRNRVQYYPGNSVFSIAAYSDSNVPKVRSRRSASGYASMGFALNAKGKKETIIMEHNMVGRRVISKDFKFAWRNGPVVLKLLNKDNIPMILFVPTPWRYPMSAR